MTRAAAMRNSNRHSRSAVSPRYATPGRQQFHHYKETEIGLPPHVGCVPRIGTPSRRDRHAVDNAGILCCTLLTVSAILAGCKTPAMARHDPHPPTATVASQTPSERQTRGLASVDVPREEVAPLPQSDATHTDKPRRLIPEWLRLGGDKEPVPLPTSPISDERPVASGPVEEFQ